MSDTANLCNCGHERLMHDDDRKHCLWPADGTFLCACQAFDQFHPRVTAALPESEERLRALAEGSIVEFASKIARAGSGIDRSVWYLADSWSEDDNMPDEDTAFIAAASPAAILAILDELTRLRAEVRRWTQYATDNADVAVRATTDAERLRASLVEAEQDSKRLAWLDENDGTITRHLLATGQWVNRCCVGNHVVGEGYDHREAIDRAALHTAEDTQ